MSRTVKEPLRDRVGRAIYEEPGSDCNWYELSDERREPWRRDADRVIPIVQADYGAVTAERDRAQQACEQIAERQIDGPIALNCANWKEGHCETCGVQWQGMEVHSSYKCPHFSPRVSQTSGE
jgi:hypothetical protein